MGGEGRADSAGGAAGAGVGSAEAASRSAWPFESWLRTARRPQIVRRSLRVAAVVGTILVAINYFDRFVAGGLTPFDGLKMALTYLVPYCVSTYAAVEAVRAEA